MKIPMPRRGTHTVFNATAYYFPARATSKKFAREIAPELVPFAVNGASNSVGIRFEMKRLAAERLPDHEIFSGVAVDVGEGSWQVIRLDVNEDAAQKNEIKLPAEISGVYGPAVNIANALFREYIDGKPVDLDASQFDTGVDIMNSLQVCPYIAAKLHGRFNIRKHVQKCHPHW